MNYCKRVLCAKVNYKQIFKGNNTEMYLRKVSELRGKPMLAGPQYLKIIIVNAFCIIEGLFILYC